MKTKNQAWILGPNEALFGTEMAQLHFRFWTVLHICRAVIHSWPLHLRGKTVRETQIFTTLLLVLHWAQPQKASEVPGARLRLVQLGGNRNTANTILFPSSSYPSLPYKRIQSWYKNKF